MDQRVTSRGPGREQTDQVEVKPSRRIAVRRIAKAIAALIVIGIAAYFGWRYWRNSELYVTTDDAYVNANVNAKWNDEHTRALIKQGYLSAQSGQATRTQAQSAAAAVKAARASLAQAESALGSTGPQNAAVRAAEARVAQAELDLQRTRISAPTGGTIANLTLRPGAPVQTGAPLFSIVSNGEFWVDANVKETELGRIHPGQRATVTIDMCPGHPFQGEVESLSGGSGTAFSLLPPENATGNWVKVTQRVPVRVRTIDPDPKRPLRVGTTVTVAIRVA